MNTKKYRTRQEFEKEEHPRSNKYIIALDAGYSSMKGYYENGYFCFPSYAKKISESMLGIAGPKDIIYHDLETDEKYMLGYTAQDMVASTDTNDTDGELYSRKRYHNKLFKILCNAAIGIALLDKDDDREVIVQTGLPTSYVKGDSDAMKNALCKPSSFRLKLANEDWREFNLNLTSDKIFIMPQPAGSLYSVLIQNNGVYVKNAKDILFSNSLVLDVGFGTFDLYGIKSRNIVCGESIDELGMREVLKHTSKKILDEMNEDIRIQALQKNLESGTVTCVNEEELKTEEKDLAPLLAQSSNEVFLEAIERTRAITNTFRDYNRLIVSGGTGQAWFNKIKDYLKNMKNLEIVPANINDPTSSFIYSNVRGYYLFRYTDS